MGTDPLIDPILADRTVGVLTAWPQATSYARVRGREDATELGIAISDVFAYSGEIKLEGTIAAMPRRAPPSPAPSCFADFSDLTR